MKAIAILILASASFSVSQIQPSRPVNSERTPHFAELAKPAHRNGGKWYFARSGHAVYCYGPVMTLPNRQGEIERVATFCGNQLLVPLKD